MNALDKVDNTLGHYAAYLRNWSPRSSNPLMLELPKFSVNRGIHTVTQGDIFETVIGNECEKPKPYPDPYLKAIQLLKTTANRCIIFEDSNPFIIGFYLILLIIIEITIISTRIITG
jgi:hypothetical protein